MLAGPVSHTDSNICKQVSPNCRRALGRLVHSQTNAPVRIGDYFGLDFVNNACTNLCTGMMHALEIELVNTVMLEACHTGTSAPLVAASESACGTAMHIC